MNNASSSQRGRSCNIELSRTHLAEDGGSVNIRHFTDAVIDHFQNSKFGVEDSVAILNR